MPLLNCGLAAKRLIMTNQTNEPIVCPQCGSDEWDLVKAERGYEDRDWFCRCYHCKKEWDYEGTYEQAR